MLELVNILENMKTHLNICHYTNTGLVRELWLATLAWGYSYSHWSLCIEHIYKTSPRTRVCMAVMPTHAKYLVAKCFNACGYMVIV